MCRCRHKGRDTTADTDRLAFTQLLSERLGALFHQATGRHVMRPQRYLEIAERLIGEFEIRAKGGQEQQYNGNAVVWCYQCDRPKDDCACKELCSDCPPIGWPANQTVRCETCPRREQWATSISTKEPAPVFADDATTGRCPVCQGTTKVCSMCGAHIGACTCMAMVRSYAAGKYVSTEGISKFDPVVCVECAGTGQVEK